MPSLERQVPFNKLKEPVCISVFDNDGIGGEVRTAKADQLREQLNQAGINFAAIDHQPPIEILVENSDVRRVKQLANKGKIQLASQFDLR